MGHMGGVRDTSVHKRVYVAAALLAGLLLVSGACGETNSDREPRSIMALPTDTPEPDEPGVGAVPLERFAYEASLTLRAGGGEDALELSFPVLWGASGAPTLEMRTRRVWGIAAWNADRDLVPAKTYEVFEDDSKIHEETKYFMHQGLAIHVKHLREMLVDAQSSST